MSHNRIEPTGSATPTGPASADASEASVAEIEADIAATRGRLAESVEALGDKVNVRARAQEKADQTRQQAGRGWIRPRRRARTCSARLGRHHEECSWPSCRRLY